MKLEDLELEAIQRGGEMEKLVEAFRELRKAGVKLLRSRYVDGECDAYTLSEFALTLEEILEKDYLD